jgi:hypothetical protein
MMFVACSGLCCLSTTAVAAGTTHIPFWQYICKCNVPVHRPCYHWDAHLLGNTRWTPQVPSGYRFVRSLSVCKQWHRKLSVFSTGSAYCTPQVNNYKPNHQWCMIHILCTPGTHHLWGGMYSSIHCNPPTHPAPDSRLYQMGGFVMCQWIMCVDERASVLPASTNW